MNSNQEQKDIFYFRTINLTDSEFDALKADLGDRTNPKTVTAEAQFTQAEKDDIAVRGDKTATSYPAAGITYADIVRTNKQGPDWTDNYPKVENVTSTDCIAKGSIKGETGTLYAVIIQLDDPIPDSQNVKNGQYGDGSPVPAGHSGSVALSADTEDSITLSNLSSSVEYLVCIVSENSTELQKHPTIVEITTS